MIKTLKLVNSWSQLLSHSTTETHLEANESPEDEIQLKLIYVLKIYMLKSLFSDIFTVE